MEKLDGRRIRELLEEADSKWFNKHAPGKYDYKGHLDFTTNYLVNNYHRKRERKSG